MPPGSNNFAGGSAPPLTPPSTTASMVLDNRYTNVSLTGVYVSPSEVNSWGPNLLNQLVGPGSFVRVENIPCNDEYDLKVTLTIGPPLVMSGVDFACGREAALTVP